MSTDNLHNHAKNLKGVIQDFPFGDDVSVYKVCGKMFALFSKKETPPRITLKCDPEGAVQMCDQFESVTPGYHMNKKHWVTIRLEGDVSEFQIMKFIIDSYSLVVDKLSKKDRESFAL